MAILILPGGWDEPNIKLLTNGKFKDIYQVYWNAWHFSERVLNFQNPWITQHLLYPAETPILLHSYTPFFGIINCLIQSPSWAILCGLVFHLVIGALGAAVFSSLFIKNTWLQFLSGLVFSFNLYTIQKLGVHYNLILIGLVPWTLWTLLLSFSQMKYKIAWKSRKYFIVFISLFLIQIIMDFYALFYVGSFTMGFLVFPYLQKWWEQNSQRKKWGIIIIIVLAAHFLSRGLRILGVNENGALWASNSITSLFIPEYKYVFSEHYIFPGWVFWITTVVLPFLLKGVNIKHYFFWIGISIFYLILCFPVIRIGHQELWYMPNALFHFIPFINNLREPSRFMEMWIWTSYIAAFIVLDQQMNRTGFHRVWVILLFSIIIGAEIYVNAKKNLQWTKPNEFAFKQMKENKNTWISLNGVSRIGNNSEARLNIPFGIKDGFSEWGLFDERFYLYQVSTSTKLCSGYFSRIPRIYKERLKENTILRGVIDAQDGKNGYVPNKEEWNQFLQENRLNGLLVDMEYLSKHPRVEEFIKVPILEKRVTYIKWH